MSTNFFELINGAINVSKSCDICLLKLIDGNPWSNSKILFFLDFLVVALPPILLPCSTNNIEKSENLWLRSYANVHADITATMNIKS